MKLAFVTGSNKGIGLAIVQKLAEYYGQIGGWDIHLTARNPELGLSAVEELKKKGLNVKFHQLDITDCESRKRFLDYVRVNYPDGIDIAVNNAAIAYKVSSDAPFGEQARVTVHTNFTCTLDFTEEFIPLLANNARVVNLSSRCAYMALRKLSPELYEKFTSPMSLCQLRELMKNFVKLSEEGKHLENGWPGSAYGTSKLGLTKACYILGEQLWQDSRRIVLNACCPGYVSTDMSSHKGPKSVEEGADTPFYLATLPSDIQQPINQFVAERKILVWSKDEITPI